MIKIEVELHEDIIIVLNKLKAVEDTGIELIVPEGAVLFENILNLKLIKSWSDRENKVINFNTNDVNGQNMLMYMENGGEPATSFAEEGEEPDTSAIEQQIPKQKISLPKIRLPFIRLKGKLPIIIAIILFLLAIGGVFAHKIISELPDAEVKIVVNSQPLTRSFEIKVKDGITTDTEQKLLKGATSQASLDDELTMETTGEKLIGEKAEGVVTIFNKTDEEKKFGDGTVLIFEDEDDDEYKYRTKDDVTVPPREEQEPDPENPDELVYIKGKADVEVEAEEIGEKYNLDDGEELTVEDKKSSEFEAEVKEDIEGGSEEKIKIVAQEDLDTIKENLLKITEEKVLRALGSNISSEDKLINGSENTSISKEAFSHSLDDETEEITLKQTFVAKGLTYKSEELDILIDKIVEDFVPEGFVLSTKERVVNVEILGNTETTVLSDTEADIQVTLKTFVVPDISENSIKNELMGKSVSEAQKMLGSIRNVKSYEFNLSPRIPFFDFVPKDENRIKVTLERE